MTIAKNEPDTPIKGTAVPLLAPGAHKKPATPLTKLLITKNIQ
jgi:hypothetical protein